MRVGDELDAKKPDIRRYARQFFTGTELSPYGLCLDENGKVAFDWGAPMNQQNPGNWTEEERQTLIAKAESLAVRFHAELEGMLACFDVYHDLNSVDFTALGGVLGGQKAQLDGPPTNIHSRIRYADTHDVAPIDGLVNGSDWERPSGWGGSAAELFEAQLLTPFHEAAGRQQAYVTELALVAKSYHDYVDEMGRVVLGIADECIAAMGGPGRITPDEFTVPIHVLSASSIVAGALSFFPPVAMVAGGVSLGAGIVSYVAPLVTDFAEGPPMQALNRATVWEVFQATREALTAVDQFVAKGDADIAKALDSGMNSATSLGHPGLVIKSPDVARNIGSAGFNRLTVQSVPGVPLSQDKVVVTMVDLYRAGKVNLYGAAGQYAQATTELDECTVPNSLNRFFPRSVAKFHEARHLLAAVFTGTRQALEDSAEALMAIARSYQTTDDRVREAFAQMDKLSTPSAVPEPERIGGV